MRSGPLRFDDHVMRMLRGPRSRYRTAFSLLELVVVIVIMAGLTAIAIPRMTAVRTDAQLTAATREFIGLVRAFEEYRTIHGEWPEDRLAGEVIPEMEERLDIATMTGKTPMGGYYDWSVDYGSKACLGVWKYTWTDAQMRDFDERIDDGKLDDGNARQRLGQYQFILEF